MADKPYTTSEIEAMRQIPARVLRYWVKNGLPHEVRGGVTFIKLSDLDNFIRDRVDIRTEYRLKKKEEDLSPDDE